MKAILPSPCLALLLLLPVSLGGQEAKDPFAPPAPVDPSQLLDLETPELPLEGVVEVALDQLGEPPNVVFQDGAGEVEIPPLRLRKVSFEALLDVAARLAPVEVSRVRSSAGSRPDIFVVQAVDRGAALGGGALGRLPDARLNEARPPAPEVRVRREVPVQLPEFGFIQGTLPGPGVRMTRAFATADLDLKDDAIVSAVTELWSAADPGWREKEAKVIYHPQTKMLIVSAPPERVEEVVEMLAQLREAGGREGRNRAEEWQMRLEMQERLHAELVEALKREIEQNRAKVMELEMELRRAQAERASVKGGGGH